MKSYTHSVLVGIAAAATAAAKLHKMYTFCGECGTQAGQFPPSRDLARGAFTCVTTYKLRDVFTEVQANNDGADEELEGTQPSDDF